MGCIVFCMLKLTYCGKQLCGPKMIRSPPQWDAEVIQTITATFWIHILTFGGCYLGLLLMMLLLLSQYWWIGVMYLTWILIDEGPHRGGRLYNRMKNIRFLTASEYYPVNLIKTVDLDPSKNYLFANFPHGHIIVGAMYSFGTETLNFSKLFPGLTSRLIMHHFFFYIPFFRELILYLSNIPSSERSIKYLLDDKRFKGNAVIGVFGGAREALESEPGRHRLVVNKHKGFVRIAIQTGTALVPVYSFGEVDVFGKAVFEEGSLLNKIQRWFFEKTGIIFLRPAGKGFLRLVPFRKPINVVVGAPLEVKKNPNPTREEIDSVHAEFKKRLINLFESEKAKYIENSDDVHLELLNYN